MPPLTHRAQPTHCCVQEHLLFFARAQGVSKSRLRAEVQHTAEKVGLDGDAFTMKAK